MVGLVDTQIGDHDITVSVTLNSNTDATTDDTAVLHFWGILDLNGQELNVTGMGSIWIHDSFIMNGGTLVLDGLTPFIFASSSSPTLDGDVEFRPDESLSLTLGASFDLFSGIEYVLDPFDNIYMPQLASGLAWNLSDLMVNGIVRVVMALTGDLDGDGFVGITDLNIVLGNWNQNIPPGDPLADPSGDGFVGIEDLNVVLGNWNAVLPPSTGVDIPEPSALMLLGLSTGAAIRRRSAGHHGSDSLRET